MFNIISKPNDWSKIVKRTAESASFSETDSFRLEYWTSMKKYIESHGKQSFRLQKPSPQHWTNISIGRSGFYLSSTVSKKHGWIRIELIFDKADAKENFIKFRKLYEEDSTRVFGNELSWNEMPDYKISTISMKKDTDTLDKTKWDEQHEWFRENLENFYTYFGPKIKSL
jgi:hypothetical protein